MKRYILLNLKPFLLGVSLALIGVYVFESIMELLAKIAILKYK